MTAVEIEPENEPDNEPEPAEETVEEVEHAEIEHEIVEAEVSVEEPVELIEPELPPGPKLTKRPDSVHDTEMWNKCIQAKKNK